jgi:hypothetical protein
MRNTPAGFSEIACLLSWMKCGEEGKLLAGAAGFLSPWGSGSDKRAR